MIDLLRIAMMAGSVCAATAVLASSFLFGVAVRLRDWKRACMFAGAVAGFYAIGILLAFMAGAR